MARQNKINMPQSGGGLTRYFEEQGSKILFSPDAVVLAILACIVVIILLVSYY
ncbi:MAG: hypothetical protein ACMXX7_01360 [Candidatus Woesearchaeota archaeon]